MAKKIFVEKLIADGCMGYTTNVSMMLQNARTLDLTLPEKMDEEPTVAIAGRFVCTFLRDANGVLGMTFFDFMQSKELAEDTARAFSHPQARKALMQAFETVSRNYELSYDAVQLVTGNNFPPNFCYN